MYFHSKSSNKINWILKNPVLIILFSIVLLNNPIFAQQNKNTSINLTIDKNSTKEFFKESVNTFKNNFDLELTIKSIERNKKNEITRIKIQLKGAHVNSTYVTDSNQPIKPIKIYYNSTYNEISIGNFPNKKHHFSHSKKNKRQPPTSENKVFIYSNGNSKSWTSQKGKSNKIIVKQIQKDKHKNEKLSDSTKIRTSIIVNQDFEYDADTDDASENVFFIKTDGISKNKQEISKKGKFIFRSSSNQSPLIIFDGDEVSEEKMNDIEEDTIESLTVLKGEEAVKKYGKKAQNGVIIITTKK